jgi:replicative DNA helicase
MEIAIELRQYLNLKKWKWKLGTSNEILVEVCPFCKKKKWKFSINAKTTKFRCLSGSCGTTGNLTSLKIKLGDLKKEEQTTSGKYIPMDKVNGWHLQLLSAKSYRSELMDRGITLEAIEHFKLGAVKIKTSGTVWLTIPHIEDGLCRNIKYRAFGNVPKDSKWRREPDHPSILFNSDVIDEYDTILLVEAEIDAISYWIAGVENVVGLTCGSDTFKPGWYEQLSKKEKIIIALDADTAGEKGSKEIACRLGYDKVENIVLPLKDANEVLIKLGKEELKATLDLAEPFEVSGIVSVVDALHHYSNEEEKEPGLFTPWDQVNRLFGSNGMQYGELVVLSARYKVGKTSWALQVGNHLAKQGTPVLINCLEMATNRLLDKMVAHTQRMDIDNLERCHYTLTQWYVQQVPFYFVESKGQGVYDVDAIFDQMSNAVRRYGIKFVIFDHLHFLCRSIKFITTEIGQLMRRFKNFARQHNIVVMLIAQPKKLGGKVIDSDDLKDSVSIPMDADWVILLHRDKVLESGLVENELDANEDPFAAREEKYTLSPRTRVIFDATRFSRGGTVTQYYDGAISTFFETDNKGTIINNLERFKSFY